MYVCKCYSVNLKKKLLDICQKLMHNYRLLKQNFQKTKFITISEVHVTVMKIVENII